MGLLVSDTMHLDLAIDDAARWQYGLIDYAYAIDSSRDSDEYEAADQSR
jgi:hypothetical protein